MAQSWSFDSSITSVWTVQAGVGRAEGLNGGSSPIEGSWPTSRYALDPFSDECYDETFTVIAPGEVFVQIPTYVKIIGTSQYTQGPPAPYAYIINREILDQAGQPINRVMFVDESFSPDPPSGSCTNQRVEQGDAFSNEAGIFGPDIYSLPGNAPNPCSSTSTQSFKVTLNNKVYNIQTTYTVRWEYSGVTVTCSAGCR